MLYGLFLRGGQTSIGWHETELAAQAVAGESNLSQWICIRAFRVAFIEEVCCSKNEIECKLEDAQQEILRQSLLGKDDSENQSLEVSKIG